MKITVTDSSWRVYQRWSRLEVRENVTEGAVMTRDAIVKVFAFGGKAPATHLTVCRDGREHCRWYKGKRYTPRSIVTKAKQFAREIAEGSKP